MHRAMIACLASTLLLGCAGNESEGPWAYRGLTEGHETSGGETSRGEVSGAETCESTGKHEETGEEDEGCTRTQGYWKNHNIYARNQNQRIPWPISEDTSLCGQSWLTWLRTQPQGDAWIILVHQWIAATLNAASGTSVPADVQTALDSAEAMLAGCSISDEDRDEALALSETLDDYNNGLMGVDHCD